MHPTFALESLSSPLTNTNPLCEGSSRPSPSELGSNIPSPERRPVHCPIELWQVLPSPACTLNYSHKVILHEDLFFWLDPSPKCKLLQGRMHFWTATGDPWKGQYGWIFGCKGEGEGLIFPDFIVIWRLDFNPKIQVASTLRRKFISKSLKSQLLRFENKMKNCLLIIFELWKRKYSKNKILNCGALLRRKVTYSRGSRGSATPAEQEAGELQDCEFFKSTRLQWLDRAVPEMFPSNEGKPHKGLSPSWLFYF